MRYIIAILDRAIEELQHQNQPEADQQTDREPEEDIERPARSVGRDRNFGVIQDVYAAVLLRDLRLRLVRFLEKFGVKRPGRLHFLLQNVVLDRRLVLMDRLPFSDS